MLCFHTTLICFSVSVPCLSFSAWNLSTALLIYGQHFSPLHLLIQSALCTEYDKRLLVIFFVVMGLLTDCIYSLQNDNLLSQMPSCVGLAMVLSSVHWDISRNVTWNLLLNTLRDQVDALSLKMKRALPFHFSFLHPAAGIVGMGSSQRGDKVEGAWSLCLCGKPDDQPWTSYTET